MSTFCDVRLCNVLPEFIVSSEFGDAGCIFGYRREVVGVKRSLRAHFSLKYLSEVTRKKPYQNLDDVTVPIPLYRVLYSTGLICPEACQKNLRPSVRQHVLF